MKKKLLCAALLAGGLMFAKPEVKAQGISVGPRLGLNFSKIVVSGSEDDDAYNEDTKMTSGIHGGVAFNIGITDMFSIQPELLYTQKGSKSEGSEEFMGEKISYESTTTLNYIQVPVLVRASFGEDTKFFVNAGPSFGMFLNGKNKTTASFMGESEDEETDIKGDDLNKLDLGLMFGAGVGINAGPGMFTLEGRYDLGLSGLDKDSEGDVKSKNRSLGVSISYMFPIGG